MKTDKKGSISLKYDNMTIEINYKDLNARLEAVIVAGDIVRAMTKLEHGRPTLEGIE